jgi:WD40 repeat protein
VCIPKITDFGLAKRLDQDLGQTQTGAIVGTPSYMAPEQALGGASVGPAADIFALGAILYELIAGRPPFKGPSVLETLELVRHAEPTPPSQLQPGCPRDLETICLKCLQKEPTRRYVSAALLADDLRRFLNHEPIQARPVGGAERLRKWLRRRPAVAASIGLAALALVALVALTVRLTYSWELEDANQKLEGAVGAKETALSATQEARRIAEHNHQEADAARTKLDAALERERALHYIHSINLAQREWESNRIDEARRILETCSPDLRHWEWRYLHRQCRTELTTIRTDLDAFLTLAVSPNGKLIAAASAHTLGPRVTVKWDLKIWDATSGRLVRELAGHESPVLAVAFSPDGAQLASASTDRTIRFWNLETGREQGSRIGGPAFFTKIAFSPDGKRLAAVAAAQIHVFDAAGGAELFALTGHTGAVQDLAFSADGARLVSGSTDRSIKLWDLATRKEIFSSRSPGSVVSVAFSPRQDQILSCSGGSTPAAGGELRVWNAKDGKPTRLSLAFPFRVRAIYGPDAGQIICAAGDGSILVLDEATGQTAFTLRGHPAGPAQLAVAADGRLVSCAEGTMRVWPIQNPEFVELARDLPLITAMALSRDGDKVALWEYGGSSGKATRLRILSAATQGDVLDIAGAGITLAFSFSPDQRTLAAGGNGPVALWDLDKGEKRSTILERGLMDLSFSPDGQWLATAMRKRDMGLWPYIPGAEGVRQPTRWDVPPEIKIWRVADGKLQHAWPGQMCVAFSPDGQRLAGAQDRVVKTWDVVSGKELQTFRGSGDPVLKVQFVDDGRQLVGFTQRRATVWDIATGNVLAVVDGLSGPAIVTADGKRLVSLHRGLIKWWDVRLGRELLFLAIPRLTAQHLALSADEERVAVLVGQRLMLWQAGRP